VHGKSLQMGDTATRYDLIESSLARLGQDAFLDPFLSLAEQSGAVQIMVFSYAPDHAACLMSRNFQAGALGARLAAQYLDQWFLQDPAYTDILGMKPGQNLPLQFKDLLRRIGPDYRAKFFDAPALKSKSTVLIVGDRLRLAVSLYWQRDAIQEDICPLLARLALLHFEARPEHSLPEPLAVLSERERAVCLGMLEGKKAEQIADDLHVAPSSVITYRRRAYAKLGINSRGSLFAICRP